MTAVTSTYPIDLPHQMYTSSPSSSSLERSISASSSATVHPLDSNVFKEERAPSTPSTSSSPTYQSNSSSSVHKTISTAVSSINTIGSRSPPQDPPSTLISRKQDKSVNLPSHSQDAAPKDYSWNVNQQRQSRTRFESEERRRSHSQWSYDQSADEDAMYNTLAGEETPMQYPPISEEEKEARAIEMNLERWASEEKLRRKAHRTSRIMGSGSGSSGGPNNLTKRFSAINILTSGRGSPAGLQKENVGEGRRNLNERNGSYGDSSDSIMVGSADSIGSFEMERGSEDSRKLAKGKSKENSDPFRDPANARTSSSSSLTKLNNVKPTPRAPIVTPGSAPTIRHRAIERALKLGGNADMPSIVATDEDEEREAVRYLQDLVIDPFQSAAEVDQHKQYLLARDATRKTILDGQEGSPIVTTPPPIMRPMSKSSSSSKFNEIGLDDDENNNVATDWLQQRNAANQHSQDQQVEVKKSWWTDWLCGCAEQDEDTQNGRTFPE